MLSATSKNGISDRIRKVRLAALEKNQKPNQTQKILEQVYGKTTSQIIESYSTYSKQWGKYIDIGD